MYTPTLMDAQKWEEKINNTSTTTVIQQQSRQEGQQLTGEVSHQLCKFLKKVREPVISITGKPQL